MVGASLLWSSVGCNGDTSSPTTGVKVRDFVNSAAEADRGPQVAVSGQSASKLVTVKFVADGVIYNSEHISGQLQQAQGNYELVGTIQAPDRTGSYTLEVCPRA